MAGVVEVANSSVYVQLLGGAALSGVLSTPTNDYDYDLGYAFAGTIGVVVFEGLSVEADLFYTHRADANFPDDSWSTTSLMANLKYTLPLNEMFSIYAAAGVGAISGVDYRGLSDTAYNYSGYGYQLMAGVTADVTDNIAVVGEVRYQNEFEPLEWEGGPVDSRAAPTVAVMAGLKLSF